MNLNFLKDLEDLFCSSNNIETLNTCNLKKIRRLRCDSAKLENLIIDTDQNLDFSFNNNPNLKYICCNPELVEMISDSVVSYGLNNCEIDSICCISNNLNFTVSNTNIYPNPVRDILHISTKETWTKAEIYDISGRIMRSVILDSQSIDVSSLERGTYFIRLRNGNKIGCVKFVKI
ncbi:MAG: T9SS type A sorting domain-containing protein [Saprospiraceae bacterium]|nr:T9SS type A sorting domain-containing protein [Saprospiraceae bacterium]